MSDPEPYLPPEIFDSIIDILHDELETLRNCSLVSKSWVPRTRMHLFANVMFRSPVDIDAWKRTFRDSAKSPAHHTHSLSIRYAGWVTDADAREDGWIRAFTNVVRLELWSGKVWLHLGESLDPFQNFPSMVRSLRLVSSCLSTSQVFKLVHSLPFLEDLATINNGPMYNVQVPAAAVSPPSISPPLTGTLHIHRLQESILRQLLKLPSGPHFREFICSGCVDDDIERMTALVERCSDTLECFDVDWQILDNRPQTSVDLSKATKLNQVSFRFNVNYLAWVIAALGTITREHKDLRRILIHIPSPLDEPVKIGETVAEETYSQWLDLDHLLVQLYELQGVHAEVVYVGKKEEEVWKSLRVLLPKTTKRG